jgi:PIN domain nuclease of toxin-antitoxin system
MRILLDTNILVAIAAEETNLLPAKLSAVLNAAEEPLLLSVASVWEMAIKVRLGKLNVAIDLANADGYFAKAGISILPVSFAHAVAEVDPWPGTNDPFDRLLLAQCQVEGLRLLTTDRALSAHPLSAVAVY